ncbi:MAG: phosphonate ABC transporter, permease protein PhnE [Dehalococcoidia bacterium]|nr:phosphonate ABC transporter, permease protein PhnE [Dehalococcoidia bacterium]
MTKRQLVTRLVYLLVAGAAVVSLAGMGLLDPVEIARAVARLGSFVGDLFPPNPTVLPTLARAMGETVQIAFVGTLLGFLFSFPLAFLAAQNLFGITVTGPVRFLLGIVRTIPSLLWAVVFVVAFGLGPAAGALGVAFYTVGYLGKLYYEAFEGVDPEVVEAVKSVGGTRLQLLVYAVLPESANALVSQFLFMFEYNIRSSTIMGFVGAGGIGFYMLGYLQLLQYRNLLTALLLTLAVVMAVDYASGKLRALVLPAVPRRTRS